MNCNNAHANQWIEEMAAWLEPEAIVWVDGSKEQYRELCDRLVEDGTFSVLSEEQFPNSFWSRSHPNDVARVEGRTFICSKGEDDCGPTNNWCEPGEMYQKLRELMRGAMRGRTMYVVPYLMGPDGSPYAKFGFELTDSAYVVVNMSIMARVGAVALKNLSDSSTNFVKGLHSYGSLDPDNRYIAHFPEDNTIVSFNSNYGGNALQGKKCFALRIASTLARHEGWMAEHMLILGITNPDGEKRYIAAAFPSACGKTNLAMLIPPKPYQDAGWKVETVGDDIAWLNFGPDGRLYAINPENGFFGVAPGTSERTNPNALKALHSNSIFTNTALDLDNNTPWWEGMGAAPQRARDWLGNEWEPGTKTKAAHPNSRFTTPLSQCPSLDSEWENPQGVPISAFIFGGRRAKLAPLVYQAFDWQHGTYVAVTMASEKTAAAEGKLGQISRDPMAMRPFIGYHAADYFRHWLEMGVKGGENMPSIFHVNWFRTDANGNFLWPGFGENMRVLEWIFERVCGAGEAVRTPIGYQPTPSSLNTEGLDVSSEILSELLAIDRAEWMIELDQQEEFFAMIGDKFPRELREQHHALKERLGSINGTSDLDSSTSMTSGTVVA